MDPLAVAGLCALLARGDLPQAPPTGLACPPAVTRAGLPPSGRPQPGPGPGMLSGDARDAIARVAFAEARNQGDSGLAAVVYTILNRLQDGRWGDSIDAVVNARSQFEPVMRAGGDWRRLAAVSPAEQARIDTILNLARDGRLPDLTGGARFFQNPSIVSARARAGSVAPGLVNFGGASPSAVIGDHSFYVAPGPGGTGPRMGARRAPKIAARGGEGTLFVGENRAAASDDASLMAGSPEAPAQASPPDPSHALFVAADGRLAAPQN